MKETNMKYAVCFLVAFGIFLSRLPLSSTVEMRKCVSPKGLLTSNGRHDVISRKVELYSVVEVDVSPFRSEVCTSES
jgi:hypothetical protein